MIAVPTRRPAITIRTCVFRRKKFPTPIRSGNRFHPVHPSIAPHIAPTIPRSTRSGSIRSTSRSGGLEALDDHAAPHDDDPLRLVPDAAVVGYDDERPVPLSVHRGA